MELSVKWQFITVGTAGIATILMFYCFWLYYLKKRAKKLCGNYIYFPPQLPLVGNTLLFTSLKSSTDVWNLINESSNRYKKGIMYWMFHIPWLVVQELDIIEAVLTSSESVEKSYVYRMIDTITDGVFSANGNRWKKLRKKANLTFSPKQLDMVYSDMNEQTAICIDVLKKNCNKSINMMTFITPFFFDTVSRTHFGIETKEQTDRLMQITEKTARVIELTIENRIFKAHYYFRMPFKLSRVNQYIEYMKIEPMTYIRQMISERLKQAELEKAKGEYEDRKRIYYVDLAKEALEELKMDPSVYNIERNTADMLIAASDTTSIAVCALFYYIAIHQDIQQKIYEEALTIFGDSSTKELTKDDLNEMKYLDMVIKEALRHTGPPGIIRELTKDLDVGKYIIPKRTNVYMTMRSIHGNPLYYEKPNEFYPEHFLPEKVKERPKFAFIPFSSGPRNCPGMAYAYMTMKSVVSTVVRNFKLESNVPIEEIKFKMVLMQEFQNGYYMKLTPRI